MPAVRAVHQNADSLTLEKKAWVRAGVGWYGGDGAEGVRVSADVLAGLGRNFGILFREIAS